MKITIRNLQNKVPVSPKKAVKTARKVLSSEGVRKNGEITLSFVSDTEIRKLNRKYLGKDAPTDVIAFNLAGPPQNNDIFADIIISSDTAVENSVRFKTSPLYELYLYVIHGMLHILGYDDRKEKDRARMRRKENDLLKELSLSFK